MVGESVVCVVLCLSVVVVEEFFFATTTDSQRDENGGRIYLFLVVVWREQIASFKTVMLRQDL